MKLYFKLTLIVLVGCSAQALLTSQVAAEASFALRCLAATTAGDAEAEAKLVGECETAFAATGSTRTVVLAHNAASSW